MKLYQPLNVPEPVAEDVWVVNGPLVRMAAMGMSMPFPTRMVVVRLPSGELFLHSPTEIDDGLRAALDRLGTVRHLVSPNRIHYAHIASWKRAYPDAIAWASPGVRARAASQRMEVQFDRDLGDAPAPEWADVLDQLVFRGSKALEEVVFFHRPSRTLLLADLIENFELDRLSGGMRWMARLGGVVDPDGKAPFDLRLTFLGRKKAARAALARMVAWKPERITLAHGRWYPSDGERELARAFRWVG